MNCLLGGSDTQFRFEQKINRMIGAENEFVFSTIHAINTNVDHINLRKMFQKDHTKGEGFILYVENNFQNGFAFQSIKNTERMLRPDCL